jgi:hypothetical protein
MKLFRFRVGQKDAARVVELDHYHRALDTVIERAGLAGPADPAEMGAVQMAFDIFDPRAERAGLARLVEHLICNKEVDHI